MGSKSSVRTTTTDRTIYGPLFEDSEPFPVLHDFHVREFLKFKEWVNRPWTWRNRLAWSINKLIGD
ncbi:Uncharacterised protein [Zhongshania aliphaticivorans]|uniref:Uncharacterized protein n=1 Tax=Zhongshania aliphaticivorans TaxID=1470434 RepID=A0A5S9MVZ5_9GAMM|nr:Uncharacterised protein [Zhongshania aliphaticivorans]CAA0085172.1 Uncharacterised protein [Zhongshania aliphaticivorans]